MVLIFLTNKTMFRTLLTTQPPTSCLLQGTWDLSWHFYSIRVSAFNRLNNNLIKHVNVIQHRLNSPLNRLPLDLNRRWWKRHRVQDGPGSQKVQLGLGADKYCVGMKYPLKFAIKNILVWLWISYIREIQMCCVQKWQMQPEWKTFLLDVALELQISSVGKFAVQQTTPSTFTIARQTVDPSLGFVSPVSGVAAPSRFPLLHAGKIFFPLNQEKPRAKEESIIQRFISPASSRSTEKEQKMKMNIFPNVTAIRKFVSGGASGWAMAFCPRGQGSNRRSSLVFFRFWQSLYLAFLYLRCLTTEPYSSLLLSCFLFSWKQKKEI